VNWEDGIYLGVIERSLEIIIGDLKGHVVKRRDMKRKVETGWLKKGLVDKLSGLPWQPKPEKEAIEVAEVRGPVRMVEAAIPRKAVVQSAIVPKRYYITDRLVKKYGIIEDCPGCVAKGRQHTEECRARIMEQIGTDEVEKAWYENRHTIESQCIDVGIGLDDLRARAAPSTPRVTASKGSAVPRTPTAPSAGPAPATPVALPTSSSSSSWTWGKASGR